jgi:DNA polymerase-1
MARSFYIIDGHAQIYRAYFAPFRELTTPSGEPAKATFSFVNMLLNLVEQRRPDYLAMVIDEGGDEAVFRKTICPQYKANRQPRPPDFTPQEQRILQIVRDAGVRVIGKLTYEADDLIATMARRLEREDFDVYIVSKDKDLRQVLSERVRMIDVPSGQIIDPATVLQEYGYTPSQAIEVQTLAGDATDNVPGIPGVGEKTAARLIGKYGTVDGVLSHLDELTPKLRENFVEHAGVLEMSRKLVTLKTDVPMEFDPEACRFSGFNIPALAGHLESLGFDSLLNRLPTAQKPAFAASLFDEQTKTRAVSVRTAAGCEYELVDDEAKLTALVAQMRRQRRVAFDTETDALGAMRAGLVGMSFSWRSGMGYYVPVRAPLGARILPKDRVLAAMGPILQDPAIEKVGHNIKYDLLAMRQEGVRLRGIAMDTMVAAFLLDAGRMSFGIDRLALDLLNFRKIATAELLGTGRNQTSMDRVPLDQITAYASEDADIAWRLSELFEKRLNEEPAIRKLHDDLEVPLVDVLAEMEYNGVAIDAAILREQSEMLGRRVEELRSAIMSAAGGEFNPDSPKQLAEVLFNRLGLRVVKRTKTGPSTDVEVLDRLALDHVVPKLILEYRSLVKLKNTYLDNLTDCVNARTGRIHASFNQTGAATGRLSCSDPNLQNIPIRTDEGRRIRLAFVPYDRQRNVLLSADYSQIELRVLAHFTQEPALIRAFENDEDIHAAVASEVFGTPRGQVTKAQRSQAKIVNFGIIYGVSAGGLARRIDGLSIGAAQDLIGAYKKRFPAIDRFLQECVMQAQSRGHVQTILGRRRPIPDIGSSVLSIRNAAERVAINSVVQGSAADLIKVAMLNIHRRLTSQSRPSKMLMQVHDELVFETPAGAVEDEAAMIGQEMTGAMKLRVPLKVDIVWGRSWGEGK